jgi:hypothetical protein
MVDKLVVPMALINAAVTTGFVNCDSKPGTETAPMQLHTENVQPPFASLPPKGNLPI